MNKTIPPSWPNSKNSNKKRSSNEQISRMCSISLFKRGRRIRGCDTKRQIA